MTRIHVICEGQTEEMFVNEVLQESFKSLEIYLYPSLIGKPGHKGGNFKFERVLRDIRNRLLSDKNAYCTTFFDFYGLPEDFPGKREAEPLADIKSKQEMIATKLVEQLSKHINKSAMRRFIPYVQIYEFEGLLFSDPESIASVIESPNLASDFIKIRNEFETPEHINNSEITAPSKRIKKVFGQYDKVIYGSLISLDIGISTICTECYLFNAWVTKLKSVKALA